MSVSFGVKEPSADVTHRLRVVEPAIEIDTSINQMFMQHLKKWHKDEEIALTTSNILRKEIAYCKLDGKTDRKTFFIYKSPLVVSHDRAVFLACKLGKTALKPYIYSKQAGVVDPQKASDQLALHRKAAAFGVAAKIFPVIKDPTHQLLPYFTEQDLIHYFISNTVTYEDLLIIVQQLVSLIKNLHDETGIAHLDIKPDNFVVKKSGATGFEIKLIDFCFSTQQDATNLAVGTPGYLAPEILMKKLNSEFLGDIPFNPKLADLYSLGSSIYTLYTKRLYQDDFKRFSEKKELFKTFQKYCLKATDPSTFYHGYQRIQDKIFDKRLKGDDPIITVIKGLMLANPHERMQLREAQENLR
jgi:hypothetical protein